MIAASPVQSAFAPGRVELLGNHTDYNGGVVLSAALELGTTATGRLTRSGCRLASEGFGKPYELPQFAMAKPTGAWTDYPLGVVHAFLEAGYKIPGVEITFQSTIPLGAGLSSSAAIEVATAMLLTKLLETSLPRLQIAQMCRQAENRFVGVNCGLLDQVSSVFGERDHAVFLDCETESIESVPLPTDAMFLITNSGAPHRLADGEYNSRREECFAAARLLGIPNLRATTSHDILKSQELPDSTRKRALHITGENERVFRAVASLGAGDAAAFGRLMTESHASSRTNFENSSPELDMLVDIALGLPGVLGARLTGGGFGGATVTFVDRKSARQIAEAISREYLRQTKQTVHPVPCAAADGAS